MTGVHPNQVGSPKSQMRVKTWVSQQTSNNVGVVSNKRSENFQELNMFACHHRAPTKYFFYIFILHYIFINLLQCEWVSCSHNANGWIRKKIFSTAFRLTRASSVIFGLSLFIHRELMRVGAGKRVKRRRWIEVDHVMNIRWYRHLPHTFSIHPL